MAPSIAVVVCTYERPEAAALALADVCAQLPEDGEVLVVDQSADPAPLEDAVAGLHDPRVRLQHAEPGLPQARNVALGATAAPILWFVDDDTRLRPGCLAAVVRAFADPRVGGVVGHIEERSVRPNASGITNRVDRAGRVRTRLDGVLAQPIETLKGCHMAFRREALIAAGGFDPGFAGTAFLEDADASTRVARLGWDLRFEPAAALVHLSEPRGGVRQDGARRTEWWRFHNTARFVRLHRATRDLPAVVAVFGAISVKRAFEWRRPDAVPELLAAMVRGWLSVRSAPPPG